MLKANDLRVGKTLSLWSQGHAESALDPIHDTHTQSIWRKEEF